MICPVLAIVLVTAALCNAGGIRRDYYHDDYDKNPGHYIHRGSSSIYSTGDHHTYPDPPHHSGRSWYIPQGGYESYSHSSTGSHASSSGDYDDYPSRNIYRDSSAIYSTGKHHTYPDKSHHSGRSWHWPPGDYEPYSHSSVGSISTSSDDYDDYPTHHIYRGSSSIYSTGKHHTYPDKSHHSGRSWHWPPGGYEPYSHSSVGSISTSSDDYDYYPGSHIYRGSSSIHYPVRNHTYPKTSHHSGRSWYYPTGGHGPYSHSGSGGYYQSPSSDHYGDIPGSHIYSGSSSIYSPGTYHTYPDQPHHSGRSWYLPQGGHYYSTDTYAPHYDGGYSDSSIDYSNIIPHGSYWKKPGSVHYQGYSSSTYPAPKRYYHRTIKYW